MLLKISIEYCAVWHYTPRATSLAAELLEKYEEDIETITLIPSDGGVYEIIVNGDLVYSKKSNGRHAEAGEVTRLVGEYLKKGK